MKRVSRWVLLLLVLLVPACDMQKKPAETALSGVQAAYTAIQEEATRVAPDQARSIEEALATAKANLDKGDFKAALAAAKELQPRVKELADRLPAMRTELESTWKSLSSSLPRSLATLNRKLSRANRPPAGAGRAEFDAAKTELTALSAQWQEAQAAMQSGRLAEAVRKAEDVKGRAVGLATKAYEGS